MLTLLLPKALLRYHFKPDSPQNRFTVIKNQFTKITVIIVIMISFFFCVIIHWKNCLLMSKCFLIGACL